MSITSLIAFIMAFAVLGIGLYTATDNVMIFADPISAFIVIGGTIAATSISFRLEKIIFLLKIFLTRVLKGKSAIYKDIIAQIIKVADGLQKNPNSMQTRIDEVDDYFLKESLILVQDNIFSKVEILDMLHSRTGHIFNHYMSDANKFKTIGKFPPAFGMMGTTIGMIVLLSNLGGADAAKSIGPAMSICLITTLYGVALANILIIPIAENLAVSAKEVKLKNQIIVEGVRLIIEGSNPIVIAEKLNSYLLPGERVDWKEYLT